ncbi:hypothetical protein CFP56_019188 [Quercus suber]|uniref:Uncharacterized protein n=1 Tax=Quercus suber TaxID=58331 RepID=A0AAW0M1T5_QUESU
MLVAMHKTRHIEFSSSSYLYLQLIQLIISFLCSMLCSYTESESEFIQRGSNKIRSIMLLSPEQTESLYLLHNKKLTNFLVGANKLQTREEEDIPSAKLRLECNSFINFSGPTGFLCLRSLNLIHLRKVELDDSWMQPDYFPVLTNLYLSHTGIVTIPESISRFTTLELLEIKDCKKLREIPRLPQSIRYVDATNCNRLDTRSSSRLLNQFGEILGILPNTIAQAATFNELGLYGYLILPEIEIPKWFKFNHHQSVGNSASFLVGPKFSNLVVCIAFPSNVVNTDISGFWSLTVSINGCEKQTVCFQDVSYDSVWLTYGKVYGSNQSEENRIEIEVILDKRLNPHPIPPNMMRIYVECICCPQKPNISPASSMDQCAFNNGEEDSGRVGIRRRLRKRNRRPTHARCPQKHYLSSFGRLRIRYRLWKPSSKPWKRRITNGFHDQGSSSIPNAFSMMIPRPILLQRRNPTLKRRLIHRIIAQVYIVFQDLTKVKPSDPDIFHLLGEVKYEFKASEGIIPMARSVRNNGAIAREQSARSARKNGAIAREESTGSPRKNGAITREESDGSARKNRAIEREELARSAKNYGAIPREESVETARNYGAITREESGTSESGGS